MRIATLALFMLLCLSARAQDMGNTLLFAHPVQHNPAMGGIAEGLLRLSVSHINRVASPEFKYNSTYVTADAAINTRVLDGGVGVFLNTDFTPGLTTTTFYGTFAYEAPLGKKTRYHHLRAGVSAGLISRSITDANLYFADQFNGIDGFNQPTGEVFARQSVIVPDVSIGLMWYRTQKIKGNPEFNHYLGLSWHHITQPSISFYDNANSEKLSTRMTAIVGGKMRTRTPFDVNASLLFSYQNNSMLWTINAFGRYVFYDNGVWFGRERAALFLGSTVRVNHSVAVYTGFEYLKMLSIGFGYDFAYTYKDNPIYNGVYGGFQVMASYTFGARKYDQPALPFATF